MRQWKLGDMIAALERVEPTKEVRFDFCYLPVLPVDSWRGIYAELAIGFTVDFDDARILSTAGMLLDNLRAANGATFTGYRGGEFTMRLGTPLHVDRHGEYSDTKVVGLDAGGYYAIILTEVQGS